MKGEDEKSCLDHFFVPRWLMDRAAAEQKLAAHAKMVHPINDLLFLALVSEVKNQSPEPSPEAITKFMADHPRDFARPLRIRIFRLLVQSEEDANKVLAEIKEPLDLTQFRALCRKYSIDRATNERGGDLGFVWPDGSTDVPQVSADRALYEAALPLQEGELLKKPVAEDKRFALVWRRGSLPAMETSEPDAERAAFLLREKAQEEALNQLVAKLSAEQVKDRKDVLLGRLRRKDTGLFVEP
jgi:peptidyl-prolyl cis-trans isomerase C